MNVSNVEIEGDAAAPVLSFGQGQGIPATARHVGHLPGQRAVKLGIRPEAVILAHGPGAGLVETQTTNVEPLGSHEIVDVRLGDTTLRAWVEPGFARDGQRVWVGLDAEPAQFFDDQTGMALRRTA
jgi:multiple sugar transport system ATP-binding protein